MTEMPKTLLRYDEHPDYWMWACIAVDHSFAVHIWARKRPQSEEAQLGFGEYYGGVEQHRPPREGEEADHSLCPFLNGPCCHDGSSLAFDEFKTAVAESIREQTPHRILNKACDWFERRWNYYNEKAGE